MRYLQCNFFLPEMSLLTAVTFQKHLFLTFSLNELFSFLRFYKLHRPSLFHAHPKGTTTQAKQQRPFYMARLDVPWKLKKILIKPGNLIHLTANFKTLSFLNPFGRSDNEKGWRRCLSLLIDPRQSSLK